MVHGGEEVSSCHRDLIDDDDVDFFESGPQRVGRSKPGLETLAELEEAVQGDATDVTRGGGSGSRDGDALPHGSESVDKEASDVRFSEPSSAAQVVQARWPRQDDDGELCLRRGKFRKVRRRRTGEYIYILP